MSLTGNEALKRRLEYIKENKKIGLMTHTVIGYPNFDEAEKLLLAMEEGGADFIELQIPFSDPIADGSTILTANHKALEAGVGSADSMRFMERMSSKLSVPLIFVTYANVPFRYGLDSFCRDAANAGAAGIIAPDLPYDDDEGLAEAAGKSGLSVVPVISSVISDERLKAISAGKPPIIYCTARLGITGSETKIGNELTAFLERVRSVSGSSPVVGFGISQGSHIEALIGYADAAVIGSKILNVYNDGGIAAVEDFLKEMSKAF